MKKTYLLSYKPTMFQALNAGFTFNLTVEVHLLWGLIKLNRRIAYEVPVHDSISEYTAHWDKLIANHKPLK